MKAGPQCRRGVPRGTALRVAPVAVVVAVLGDNCVEGRQWDTTGSFGQARNVERAPELMLVRSDGSSLRLSDFRGRTVMVHFWATWCPMCRGELPTLLELSQELRRESGFELVAVSVDEGWAAVRDYFQGSVPPEVMLDPTRRGYRHYGVTTLPDSFLVGPDGRVIARIAGARDWSAPAVRAWLRNELQRVR